MTTRVSRHPGSFIPRWSSAFSRCRRSRQAPSQVTWSTEWGENVAILTDDDADVILWNNGVGAVTTEFSLGDAREKDADVGTLAVQGPLDAASTTLILADDVDPPTAWWRLTHPLALFGLD